MLRREPSVFAPLPLVGRGLPTSIRDGTLRAMSTSTQRQRGFNLIELMLGITVLSILLGIGVPSFTQMIRNNRLVEQTNTTLTALNYARSEALKRGFRVSVCPGSGAACSGGTDWNAGILVFTDDTGTTGTIDGSDAVLQSWPASSNGFVAGGSAASITFLPTGAQADAQIDIYKDGCTGLEVRRISVVRTGRVDMTKRSCT
jgi:type IV fimbrial biogenesis protein FimT